MIRPYRPGDAATTAPLFGAPMGHPEPTPGGLDHWLATQPARARLGIWVAEEEGEIVGTATARIVWTIRPGDVAFAWLAVREDARGRGIGSALAAAAEAHVAGLPVRKLETFAVAGTPGQRFAEARGFSRTRTELAQTLVLADADVSSLPRLVAGAAAQGGKVVPLRALADRADEVYEVFAAAESDIPADDPEDDMRLDEFVSTTLDDPELDRDLSAVVLVQGRPAALSFLLVNPRTGVGANAMTGTHPEFRRRGLARLAKLSVIAAARDAGLRELHTGNDAENVGMLTLNRELGYRVVHRIASLSRTPAT